MKYIHSALPQKGSQKPSLTRGLRPWLWTLHHSSHRKPLHQTKTQVFRLFNRGKDYPKALPFPQISSLPSKASRGYSQRLLPIPPHPLTHRQHQFRETSFMMPSVPTSVPTSSGLLPAGILNSVRLHIPSLPFLVHKPLHSAFYKLQCWIGKILLLLNPFFTHSFHLTALMKTCMSWENIAPP